MNTKYMIKSNRFKNKIISNKVAKLIKMSPKFNQVYFLFCRMINRIISFNELLFQKTLF